MNKLIKHPVSVNDKDYLRFEITNDGIISCITKPFRMISSEPLNSGLLLMLNEEALLALRDIEVLGQEYIINEWPEFYDLNKRFLEGEYKKNYYVKGGERFCEGDVLENLDIIRIMPVNDSFKEEKEFFRTDNITRWLSYNGFSAANYFYGAGTPDAWSEIKGLDKSMVDIINDFNKINFVYTNHFCCSGLNEEHQGMPYREYGFIRFKHDLSSSQYSGFEKRINALESVEIVEGEVNGLELRVNPIEEDHDQSLKQSWKKVHEVIQGFQ